MVSVILVEADRKESAFASIAIALRRPHTKDAPHNGLESFLKRIPPCTTVVGLAANVTRDGLDRALRAGVKKVYGKPTQWRAYVDTIEGIFRDSLAIPAVAAGGGEADRCLSC